ncbi:unnamed protein product [Urochloa humidicola]
MFLVDGRDQLQILEWNRMVKEFHVRNKYVSFTKTQIQDKEGQLKKDYKMLKAAKEQSGSTWNEKRCMVEGSPALWENLMMTWPKIKKFNNSKASFPLFDALGELYDGHLAQGTYNVTSLEEESPGQLHDAINEPPFVGEDPFGESHGQLPMDASTQRDEEMLQRDEESEEAPIVQGSEQRRPTTSRNKHEKEPKRPRRNEEIVGIMGAYLEMRTKQAEVEAADRAREMEEREREARERQTREMEERERQAREREERQAREREDAQASDFSIKRCFTILNTLAVTKEEKAKGYAILIKSKENREAFVCACELDEESALIWLRSEMMNRP